MFPYSDDLPHRNFPLFTTTLIIVNFIIFFRFGLDDAYPGFVLQYGFIPAHFQLTSLITAMFLHSGLFHLVFNMWYLFIFGDNLEDRLGKFTFLIFYLTGGIFAFFAHSFTADALGRSLPCIGASGAVSAVMGGYLAFFPFARVKVFVFLFYHAFTFKISAQAFLVFWFVEQILNGGFTAGSGGGSSVAYAAHIGGFFYGFVVGHLFKNYFKVSNKLKFGD